MLSSEKIRRAFTPSDLSDYSFRERLLIRIASAVFYLTVRLVGATTRFDVEGYERFERLVADGHAPIIVLWHNRSFLASYWMRGRRVIVLTSHSFDGEYITRFIQNLGLGAVRGSSSRGAVSGLVEMARYARNGFLTGISPDGPRGPVYRVKTGTALLAKKSGQPMLPLNVTAIRRWKMRSWDGYNIPKPFSRAVVRFGDPVWVAADANDEIIAAKTAELQRAMDDVYEGCE
ncbi:MAG TPA: lysophospholipid acyltransferase family protein [Pyrinomonadaceae bacterium]|nr:lysophospholipid acyltransferase family protein [Pyrinomonadaceae bacterium]